MHLKLAAAFRLRGAQPSSSVLPKWAKAFDDPSYFGLVASGRINGRHSVVVLSNPSCASVRGKWGGSWSVDFTGAITVELQDSYVAACKKAGCAWALGHTIHHELLEAKEAIALARSDFPNSNPFIVANRGLGNLEGEAHLRAIQKLDGISEIAYDRELAKEGKFLKW